MLAQVHERGLGVVQLDRGGLFGDTLERSCRYAGLAQQMQRLIVAQIEAGKDAARLTRRNGAMLPRA